MAGDAWAEVGEDSAKLYCFNEVAAKWERRWGESRARVEMFGAEEASGRGRGK
jgi:hypothetical protein